MTHFIPTLSSIPTILSSTDKDYLVTVFTHYISTTAYPDWFAEHLTKPYFTLAHAISLALFKHGKTQTGYKYTHELSTITFNPSFLIYSLDMKMLASTIIVTILFTHLTLFWITLLQAKYNYCTILVIIHLSLLLIIPAVNYS